MVTKLGFIVGAFAFIMVITQLGALMGVTIFSGTPDAPKPPDQPTGAFSTVSYPVKNIIYFFQLMGISGSYAFLGVIVSVLVIGIIWCILELIRGN